MPAKIKKNKGKTKEPPAKRKKRLNVANGSHSDLVDSINLENMRTLYVARKSGKTWRDSYRIAFPGRKVTDNSATVLGKRYYQKYIHDHESDLQEMLRLNFGVSPMMRYAEKLDELLDAMTLKNVKTVHEVVGEEGEISHVVLDETIEVTDNTNRMNAVRELGSAIGAHKSDINTANVIIYNAGEIKKPKRAGASTIMGDAEVLGDE